MNLVGEPSEEDLSFMTEDPAIQYVKEMSKGLVKKDLSQLYPNSRNKDLTSLVSWLLSFNPFYRCSASEALKSQIFDKIRDTKKEKSARVKLTLDID